MNEDKLKKEVGSNKDKGISNKSKRTSKSNKFVSTTKNEKKGGKVTKVKYESVKEIKIDRVLVDNFIALQRVMITLSSKLDKLSEQLSNFLSILEESAKNLAKKDFEAASEKEEMKKILEKLDKLSQQAGLIGKGLALIHEANLEKVQYEESESYVPTPTPYQQPLIVGAKKEIEEKNLPKIEQQTRSNTQKMQRTPQIPVINKEKNINEGFKEKNSIEKKNSLESL